MKKVKQILSLCLFMMFLGAIVLLLMSRSPRSFLGYSSYTVLSGSMKPTLSVGSVIIVKAQDSYNKGDIITFHSRGTIVTHRIVDQVKANNQLVYITKGDANSSSDKQAVSINDVKGAYILQIAYLGYLQDFVRKPAGFLGLIVAPSLALIFLELTTIKKEIEKEITKRALTQHENT